MTIEGNRALVLAFYERMSNLDFAGMFDLMDDAGTWTVAGNPALFHHAGTATKIQRQQALAAFTNIFATLEQTVVSTTVEDDRVAARMIARCVTHGGLVYENEMLVLLTCCDGRIVSIYEHLDQATTLEFEARLATADTAAH